MNPPIFRHVRTRSRMRTLPSTSMKKVFPGASAPFVVLVGVKGGDGRHIQARALNSSSERMCACPLFRKPKTRSQTVAPEFCRAFGDMWGQAAPCSTMISSELNITSTMTFAMSVFSWVRRGINNGTVEKILTYSRRFSSPCGSYTSPWHAGYRKEKRTRFPH